MIKYTCDDLRDIYYLFSYHHPDYDEMIAKNYPELVKYTSILRNVLHNIYIFKGSEPYFHLTRHENAGFGYLGDIIELSYRDGVQFMSYLLDMLFQIPDQDLPLINSNLLNILSFSFKDNILFKLKTFLLPEKMVEENLNLYVDNYLLHLKNEERSGSIEDKKYRDLYLYDNKLIDFRRKINHQYNYNSSYFFYMILAYFYANASRYNNDYNLIDNMLLNFHDQEDYYLKMYQDTYPYKDQNGSPFDDLYTIYQFVEKNASILMQNRLIMSEDCYQNHEGKHF